MSIKKKLVEEQRELANRVFNLRVELGEDDIRVVKMLCEKRRRAKAKLLEKSARLNDVNRRLDALDKT